MPWRNKFSSNEEYNAWYRDYRAKNRKKIRQYNKSYNKDWRKEKGYHNEIDWKKKNPEKVAAQTKLHYAVRTGKIFKRACLMCRSKATVAHHPNYLKPLEVLWVCKVHHRQIHYGN